MIVSLQLCARDLEFFTVVVKCAANDVNNVMRVVLVPLAVVELDGFHFSQ